MFDGVLNTPLQELTLTCSKPSVQTPEKGVKYTQS